jgi:hypothetical protein
MSEPADQKTTEPEITGGYRPWRLGDLVKRCSSAMLAELGFVDCHSLDVLLYCPDDLAAVAPDAERRPGTTSGQDALQSAHDLRIKLRT